MSSTNRGSVRSPLDFYETPAWCVRALWASCPAVRAVSEVYDPACGSGAILLALRDMDRAPWLSLFGSDIDEGRVAAARSAGLWALAHDYLGRTPPAVPVSDSISESCAVVMNPPYSLAEQFVRRTRIMFGGGRGPVAALLRIAFLSSQGRAEWLAKDAPDVYVLPRRPDFTGGGGDSADYAWMVWPAGAARTEGRVRVIPLDACQSTPTEVAADRERKSALRAARKAAEIQEAAHV